MWWHMRRNQISSFGENGRVHLNRRGASVQSTTGSRGVSISGSNAGYTMFRGTVKCTGYPLHLPVSPSLPFLASPCAITFQLDSSSCIPSTRSILLKATLAISNLELHVTSCRRFSFKISYAFIPSWFHFQPTITSGISWHKWRWKTCKCQEPPCSAVSHTGHTFGSKYLIGTLFRKLV